MTAAVAWHWVGADWLAFEGERRSLRSPIDGSVITEFTPAPAAAAEVAVAAAADCDLAAVPLAERCRALRVLAERLAADAGELARQVTLENGCPSAQAEALQVGSAVALLQAMADIGEEHRFEERRPGSRGGEVLVQKMALGIAVGIVPWNVPMFLASAKLASAVIAGCPIILKPSPENAASMVRYAGHLEEIGLPSGAVNLLVGDRDLGAALVAHPGVAKVSFTGSTAAGREVATACAARLARCTLELGGKSAAILLDDVDIGGIRNQLFLAMLQNNGQVCGAQSRLLVPAARYDELREALSGLFEELVTGDPRHAATDIGPVVHQAQARRIEALLERARAAGALPVNRPVQPPGPAFVAPVLLEGVNPNSEIWREEVFGPVVTMMAYQDEAHAVALADDSHYGLSGSVWSPDIERAAALARRLRTGTVGVNSKKILDFAAPFGGFRQSGIGREFGPEGIDGYLEAKSILLP